MPCVVVILILAFPRLVLALLFLFTHYLQHAYDGLLVPLLGFFFLPITTIVYAWLLNSGRGIHGANLLILLIAVVIDLGGLRAGERHRHRR